MWHVIIDINMFPIYLSITTKEVGGGKDRLRRGAPWAWSKYAEAKILPKCVLVIL